ncbi:response regulator [Thalassotalea piscium]|uniref:Two-component system chemotaxis response regulator CheY n=1 Tax=Thalassotalea piscium TaxID=1230533 RepID=A0A7X0TTP1_9GAMM|nr:response regulator [Thalassotalea piscium]MBB6543329.1 two-component system chemotaxis response regulator CheY [Thalassotalea piscium]
MASLQPSELSILLIEPSDTQRKIIINHLKKHEINEVTSANNMISAKQVLARHQFDLIISSLYLEDGTALDLLNHIRSDERLAETPFMLVSSEHKRENLEEFKQSGVVAILPKPFTAEHLHSAINTTLDLLTTDEIELEHFDVHQIRVLLVDDSALARKFIKRVLNNLGLLKITEAADGSEAITLISENMYDLVVTDFNMPEVDGRELTRYIREKSQQSHIPILMVTSESNDAHLANIETDGVNALCDKPFEPEYVKQVLFRLLEH